MHAKHVEWQMSGDVSLPSAWVCVHCRSPCKFPLSVWGEFHRHVLNWQHHHRHITWMTRMSRGSQGDGEGKMRSCLKIQRFDAKVDTARWEGTPLKGGGGAVKWKTNLQASVVACHSIHLPSLYEFYPTCLPCDPWIVCLTLSFVLFALVWWLILPLLTFCHMKSCFFHHAISLLLSI